MRGPSLVQLTGPDHSAADIVVQNTYILLHLWYLMSTGTAVFIHISRIYSYSTADEMYQYVVCAHDHHL